MSSYVEDALETYQSARYEVDRRELWSKYPQFVRDYLLANGAQEPGPHSPSKEQINAEAK